jgi:hypothetical protein
MKKSPILERNPEITVEVVKLLSLCKKAQLSGWKDADLNDGEFVAMYVATLLSQGCKPGFIGKCTSSLLASEEFWPKPCTVVKFMLAEKSKHEAAFGKVENPRCITDAEGNSWAVSGKVLELGWEPPAGVQAPELPKPGISQRQRFVNAWNKLRGKYSLPSGTEGDEA